MQFRREDLRTIPNIMTYFRFLAVPAFVLVYTNSKDLYGNLIAIAIVAFSAITDIFDGVVARKTGQVTDIGKILDPIADKAIEFAMLFCIIVKYRLVVVLVVIFGVKEIISLAFSSYLLTKGKYISGAQWYGKLCTVVLYIVMLAFLIVPNISPDIEKILVIVAAAFMILAFVLYMREYLKLWHELNVERSHSNP